MEGQTSLGPTPLCISNLAPYRYQHIADPQEAVLLEALRQMRGEGAQGDMSSTGVEVLKDRVSKLGGTNQAAVNRWRYHSTGQNPTRKGRGPSRRSDVPSL